MRLSTLTFVLSAAAFGVPATGSAASPVGTGTVTSFGDAGSYGAPGQLNAPLADIVATPDGAGYWLVAADGGVFAYGDATFEGSWSGTVPGVPVVGMASTSDGKGYWLVDSIGEVTALGDATAHGSLDSIRSSGGSLNGPVVGMAAGPGGAGYWLIAADGGVFAYGDAAFEGSAATLPLNAPVVGMAATPDGGGYWLVAADGGVFAYGDAAFEGSAATLPLNAPVVGMAATPDGGGYWLVAADGGVFAYGDAAFEGSLGTTPPPHPVMAMAAPGGHGYWLATAAVGPTPSAVTQVAGDCVHPQVEPSRFTLACGDGNAYLDGVTWSSWTRSIAFGRGTYWQNDCTPDCAHGRFESSPGASIELSRPVATSAGVEFTTVTVSYSDPTSGARRNYTEGWYTSPT